MKIKGARSINSRTTRVKGSRSSSNNIGAPEALSLLMINRAFPPSPLHNAYLLCGTLGEEYVERRSDDAVTRCLIWA